MSEGNPQRLPAGVYENAVAGETGSGAGTAEEGHLMTLKVSGKPGVINDFVAYRGWIRHLAWIAKMAKDGAPLLSQGREAAALKALEGELGFMEAGTPEQKQSRCNKHGLSLRELRECIAIQKERASRGSSSAQRNEAAGRWFDDQRGLKCQ